MLEATNSLRSTTNGVTQAITYDNNGNTLNSGGRVLTWNADNQPTQASNWPTSERYLYDADGERVKRTNVNTATSTYYMGGLYEKDTPTNTTRTLYQLNGQVIAQRSVNSKGTHGKLPAHRPPGECECGIQLDRQRMDAARVRPMGQGASWRQSGRDRR